jgi:hypothetical protein
LYVSNILNQKFNRVMREKKQQTIHNVGCRYI